MLKILCYKIFLSKIKLKAIIWFFSVLAIIVLLLTLLVGTILVACLVEHYSRRNHQNRVYSLAYDKETTEDPKPSPIAMKLSQPKPFQRAPKFFQRRNVNNNNKRNAPGLTCRTAIPKCYEENKKFYKFSDWLDVQIYSSDIFRKIMTLLCIVSNIFTKSFFTSILTWISWSSSKDSFALTILPGIFLMASFSAFWETNLSRFM